MANEAALKCRYCLAALKTDAGFANHACAKKLAAVAIGEENVLRAHRLFNFWFYINRFSRKKESKTVAEFIRSPYFNVFCSLYGYGVKTNLGDLRDYVKWLSTNNIPAAKWETDAVADRYQRYMDTNGDAYQQALKTIEHIILWADEHETDYRDFFANIPVDDALKWIERRDISPWVFCLSEKVGALINRFEDHNMEYLGEILDLTYWLARIEISAKDSDKVKALLKELDL